MYKDTSERLEGNDIFEGYAIDLIKEIADILRQWTRYLFSNDYKVIKLICLQALTTRLNGLTTRSTGSGITRRESGMG